jgi:hypothetical protein
MDQNTARSLARRISTAATDRGVSVDNPDNPDVVTLVLDCIDAGVDPQAVLAN